MENSSILTGPAFRDMLISAANAINAQKHFINELNVFPVPDGDTGTNMSMTMSSAVRELQKYASSRVTVGEVADAAAGALLRGARGNSGVILSLLFRGIAKGLKDRQTADGEDIIAALLSGVEAAYKAVMKPAEGTILTVARESAMACVQLKGAERADCLKVFTTAAAQAEVTLAKTTEMLPVLKKAGVVDAGGKGYAVILSAMCDTLSGKGITAAASGPEETEKTGGAAGETEEDIHFTYCTEFLINRQQAGEAEADGLRAFLGTIGDCVLVADDKDIIKVHVHTNNPDQALGEALKLGYLSNIKIDNMRLQHEEKAAAVQKAEIDKPLGFVAVASGKGVVGLFQDLGVDKVVEGGQTMNPSTEDILSAIESTTAETVVVLPNNKNIILAAEQAVALSDRKVFVLHTKTIPQGITAMLNFDTEAPLNDNLVNMQAAMDSIKTGLVTFAARDSDFDGRKIKKDEILALAEGKLSFTESDPVRAAVRLTKALTDKSTSYVTVLYGEGVSADQGEQVRSQVAEKLGSQAEVTLVDGGQPVYHFIISVE